MTTPKSAFDSALEQKRRQIMNLAAQVKGQKGTLKEQLTASQDENATLRSQIEKLEKEKTALEELVELAIGQLGSAGEEPDASAEDSPETATG